MKTIVFDARKRRSVPVGFVVIYQVLAERGGFEPPMPLQACRISSAVRSTTLPPLPARYGAGISAGLISCARNVADRARTTLAAERPSRTSIAFVQGLMNASALSEASFAHAARQGNPCSALKSFREAGQRVFMLLT